ncbi:MAG: hypothetical protein QG588_1327, partial [Candidatus Poribacteria bacterium]|nr:hypothetical protein [Candidatus Poribacteria bacterium]
MKRVLVFGVFGSSDWSIEIKL